MKKLLAFIFALVASAPVLATDTFTCDCQTGSTTTSGITASVCAPFQGSDTYNGLSRYPGKLDDGVTVNAAYGPKQTIAASKTILASASAGSYSGVCSFGRWPETTQATGATHTYTNWRNGNFTRTSPGTLGSYDLPGLTGDSGSGGTVTYTSSTVTDTSKSWDTTANGGLGQWAGWSVKVVTNNDYQTHIQIRKIASNTATAITLQSGPTAYSMLNERFIKPLPIAGAAYTIVQTQPEMTNTSAVQSIISFQPGTLKHGEGYRVYNLRLVGSVDGAPVTSVVSVSNVVTVTTSSAHGLTTGDLAAIVDVVCTGCVGSSGQNMLASGASVTVVDATHFTYACSTCSNGTGAGNPTMYYRKVGLRLMLFGNEQSWVTVDTMDFDGGTTGLQGGGPGSGIYFPTALPCTAASCEDGVSDHLTVLNSTFQRVTSFPALLSGSYEYLYGNLFDSNGTTVFDHHLYLGGGAMRIQEVNPASISGNGTTTSVVLDKAPQTGHPLENATITVTNSAACSTSGSPNVAGIVITRTDATHFTYPSTCSGTSGFAAVTFTAGLALNATTGTLASPWGGATGTWTIKFSNGDYRLVTLTSAATTATWAYGLSASATSSAQTIATLNISENWITKNVVVYRNTMLNGNMAGEGKCIANVFVVHGRQKGMFILDNDIYEPTANPACWGIAPSTGSYGQPETEEKFEGIYIVGNRVSGMGLTIGLDLCHRCVVANNWVVPTTDGTGIRVPAKDVSYPTSSTRLYQVDVLNNTIYFPTASQWSVGIEFSRDAGLHRVANNLIYFGTGWTTASSYFCTDCHNSGTVHYAPYQLDASAFSVFDYNFAYALGQSGTKPQWNAGTMNGGALGNVVRDTIAKAQDVGLDVHSVDSCDPGMTTPTLATHFDLSFALASCAQNAGHPTLKPYDAMFMRLRSSATPGAFDPSAATSRLPGPVYGIGVQ